MLSSKAGNIDEKESRPYHIEETKHEIMCSLRLLSRLSQRVLHLQSRRLIGECPAILDRMKLGVFGGVDVRHCDANPNNL